MYLLIGRNINGLGLRISALATVEKGYDNVIRLKYLR